MAGRIVYTWDSRTQALLSRISDVPLENLDDRTRHVLDKFRYNCPPASHLPVVAQDDGQASVLVARWGFPMPKRWNGVFNTRVENVDSPMWRAMWGVSHGVFVVRGFYEWQGPKKVPQFIHRADGEPMVLAALIGERKVQGESKICFSLLTCAPNQVMAPVHDRMPIILEAADARDWLAADTDHASRLAVPCGDDVLTMYPVGPDVGSTQNDRPDLMEPIERQGLGAFT